MEIRLIVLEGVNKDREIPLPETIFLIGRDRQCHIRPHCALVSQLHCAIAAWGGKVRVRDLKSRNGTFLNGEAIDGEALVVDGDELRLGTLVFAFRITNKGGTPIAAPIQDEHDLEWLLDSPADSSILSPACQTGGVPAPTGLTGGAISEPGRTNKDPPGAAAPTRGSKAVSAGQHLRSYVESRKRRPRGPAGSS